MTTAADVVVSCLARQGVKHLFGMPGSHSTALYDALNRDGTIATVLIRNEQAGAFAADGYARVSGLPGVICTTAGPGATNALSGIAEAWADSVPVLLLAGQVNADRMHQECGAYHEIDLESIFKPVTRWCGTVRDADAIPRLIGDAFAAVQGLRPRPAALILPQDVMRQPAVLQEPPAHLEVLVPTLPAAAIAEAASLLAGAERPIVLAGGGALWGNAALELVEVAAALRAPVVTSVNAKGLIDERDPASLGHARSARARAVLPHADAMLAVGCRFTEILTERWRMPVPAQLVQIDVDPEQIGMNYPVTVGIVADARPALAALLDALRGLPGRRATSGWGELGEVARTAHPPRPEWLIETLRAELPDAAPLFCDACEMGYRLQTDWTATGPRRFFYPSNYIALGWGFPAALGASFALGDLPVAAVSGDGGFLMTAQELATAARYRRRVIALVHNDSTYGAIKNIQRRAHDSRYIDVDLNNPDFPALAAAYGVPGERAHDAAELRLALRRALDRDGPSLIEVPDAWRPLRV
jgi:acetolactate synthase-1/2/3 large subunit